ncbi:DNA replication initiation factor cdc45 [Dimargaris verticillata]|uniref:DNA replication initiation factor cdc45 n=1 Tax=Dimargaris verticillata TaxID=2761393 RepID=A0A9W8B634_9FUNG|nr:DNA replication initiation factor cdc45 [Dimargaris verticillata]
MVYITPEQYDDAYQRIVRQAVGRHGSVLILVAPDPDALCALKILLTLLRNDSVTYHMVPVAGYADLARVNQQWLSPPSSASGLLRGQDLRSIVCLNCGALADLEEVFTLPPNASDDADDQVTLYVLDSHRPFSLHNLFQSTRIVVFDDGDVDQSLDIVRQAYDTLAFQPDDASDSEPSSPAASTNGGAVVGIKRPWSPEAAQNVSVPQPTSLQAAVWDEEQDDDSDVCSKNSDGTQLPPARRRRTGLGSATAMPVDEPLQPSARHSDASDVSETDEPNANGSAASSQASKSPQQRLSKRVCHQIIQEYYARGSFYGQSTSVTLYMLALQLSRETPDMLWYAIVGLTHQFLFNYIDEDDYWGQVQIYSDEVVRLFPSIGQDAPAAIASDPTTLDGAYEGAAGLNPDDTGGNQQGKNLGSNGATDEGIAKRFQDRLTADAVDLSEPTAEDSMCAPRTMAIKNVRQPNGIAYSEEFKFMLLRHWSLYESMQYSPYLAAKLGIWSERGRRLLRLMLAKMGFSLTDSRQIYSHMSPENKSRLRAKLDQVAPDYGCGDLVFPSFVRSFGWRKGAKLAASDVVYGLVALLKGAETQTMVNATGASEDGRPGVSATASTANQPRDRSEALGNATSWTAVVQWRDGQNSSTNGNGVHLASDPASKHLATGDNQSISDTAWLSGFYTAYDALTDLDLIHGGIQLSMRFQRAIVEQGMAVIERRSVKTLKTFRLAVLTDSQPLFHHPLTLTQLALFLLHSIKHGNALTGTPTTSTSNQSKRLARRAESLPLVIASFNPVQNAYLVVGLSSGDRFSSVKTTGRSADDIERRNPFGIAFRETAERTGARTRHDSFESSVVEIAGPDLSSFIEYLHLYL